jgi:hypothetical protein
MYRIVFALCGRWDDSKGARPGARPVERDRLASESYTGISARRNIRPGWSISQENERCWHLFFALTVPVAVGPLIRLPSGCRLTVKRGTARLTLARAGVQGMMIHTKARSSATFAPILVA